MGQGYSLTSISAGAAALDSSELSDLTYERSLGNARFMKTIRARRDDGLVVAKLAMKSMQNQNWDQYVKALSQERKKLYDIPNALGYHRIQQTSTTGILTRQFIHASLYDRISTRPFLDVVEKRWLAFQLLCAVRDAHARDIFHGDIKTENVLVTSWNWLYLTDFSSSYKSTYLPEDNPADFSFYFDTSGRRTCYLAPERFLKPGEDPVKKHGMNWSMDIFSVGCVIAELFLETPIFSLSQLLRYRANEYDPQAALEDIKDPDIREMVAHMIQLDPQARYAADEYLNFWRGKAFPEYFSSFLHQYMHLITDPTSGRKPITSGQENLGESDDRIDRVYNDFDKIAFFLGYDEGNKTTTLAKIKPSSNPNALFPLQIDIPNHRHTISTAVEKPSDNGSLLFLTLVEASLRSTARASPRMKAMELLLAFAERVPDEVKLDRILPYLMDMLNEDQTEPVRIYALRATTQLLELVQTITAQNAYVFTEYILPRIRLHVIAPKKNPSTALRATYASCLASLAITALRFLEMMQALRMGGTALAGDPELNSSGQLSFTTLTQLYDNNRADLLSYFEDHTTGLLEDTETSVRRAFLGSISTLCFAFGSAKASDVVLSHLNTYLNDRDWQLKCAFFETIVGVATYVGSAPLEEYMLPLMVQALTDSEETVVERVLRSFSALAELGLFQKSTLWELVDIVARFTMHPNTCIREAAAFFISSATQFLSVADQHSIIVPLIRVYLKTLPSELTELVLLDALKKPLPRVVFDYAILWAQRTEKGSFWKAAQIQHTFTFSGGQHVLPTTSGKDLGPRALSRIPQNEEDHVWLARLRAAGMTADDEFKLVALREFIIRVAHRRTSEQNALDSHEYGTVTKLSDLNVTPQLVFFDKEEDVLQQHAVAPVELELRRKTIAEALQDAREDRLSAKPGHIAMPKPMYGGDGDSGASTPVGGIDIPMPRGLRSPASGPQVASSADSRPSIRSEHRVKRKGSSISLIGVGKAKAETGTTVETAIGRVDTASTSRDLSRRSTQLTVPQTDVQRRSSSHSRLTPTHNYRGNDPTVLRLLDAMYLEKYPQDLIDFGPLVARRQNKPIKRVSGQPLNAPWKPEGTLVAMLSEHTDGVNRIVVAPDHAFFVTGSDDGTVKIWDTQRLERNVTNRSRQTHKQGEGVKVTSLTFIEDTHCFVSTGNDGSIHVVRVDYQLRDDGAHGTSGRYGRLRIVREHYLPQGEYVTWTEQFRDDHKSVLLISTSKCRIIALELRNMEILYELQNPVRHGIPLCFCVDKRRHWLVVGSTHGVLDLWDLRFRMRIKAYSFAGGAPIHRLTLIPTPRPKSKQLKIAVAGGTGQAELTIWDIEKVTCTNVYRTGTGAKETTSASYKLAEIDEDKSGGGMLQRFSTIAKSDQGSTSSSTGIGTSIRATTTHLSTWEGSDGPRYHFLLTAGPDWKVRFWDTSRPESSTIVSGMELEEGKPTYTISQPSPDLQIVTERLNPVGLAGGRDDAGSGNSTPSRREGKKSRSSVISMQAQVLLKTHLDMVTDVAFLEVPYGMVVSADRAGVVYVFS